MVTVVVTVMVTVMVTVIVTVIIPITYNALSLRAPGRVNLIGEHVDYCGFPVLPIAIQQDVVIAGRTDQTDRTLTVCNTDISFQEYSCSIRDVQVWGICCSCSIRDVQVWGICCSCSIRDVQVWGICCSCSIRDVQVWGICCS